MNQYEELIKNKEQEQNQYPFMFSTLDEMEKELAKRNVKKEEVEYYFSEHHFYIIQTHVDKFNEIAEKYEKEIEKRIEEDITGEGFIKDMFKTQLKNYEYGYTLEVDDAIERLGYTLDQIDKDIRLKNGLELAKKEILKEEEELEI